MHRTIAICDLICAQRMTGHPIQYTFNVSKGISHTIHVHLSAHTNCIQVFCVCQCHTLIFSAPPSSILQVNLTAFENELGVQAPVGFWDPVGFTSDGDVATFKRQAPPIRGIEAWTHLNDGHHGLLDCSS